MNKKILIIVFIVVTLIVARIIITGNGKSQSEKSRHSATIPSVTVETVQTRNITRQFEANARVVAKYRVDVLARISGYLTKSYFKEGDYVKTGQVLFEIEPQEYQYAASKAKANLDNIQSQAAYYKKQLARYKDLVSQDYVAKSEYDSILAQSSAYNAQVDSALSAYRDAQRNLSYTKLKAPVNGRVGIIDVTVGNFVSPSSGSLTTINSFEPMYITFPIDAKDYAELVRIDNGSDVKRKVEFRFSTGKKYDIDGIQDFYDNEIDATTGTITLRATFPNPNNELIQGDFGKVIIYSNSKDDVAVVPQSATQDNQEGRFVYTLDENKLPKLVYIKTIGQTNDGMWLVSDGLKAGDIVVTSGIQKIIPGSPVKIVQKAVLEDTKVKRQGFVQKVFKKLCNVIKKCKRFV